MFLNYHELEWNKLNSIRKIEIENQIEMFKNKRGKEKKISKTRLNFDSFIEPVSTVKHDHYC